MLALIAKTPVQPRAVEGFLRLRIGYVLLPAEPCELLFAPFAHRLDQRWIAVTDEILKRSRFPVLFAHEEQRHKRREQHRARRELQFFEADDGGKTISQRAIPHLIVVLREY